MGGKSMSPSKVESKRRRDRTKAVLPVRVKGKDVTGNSFDELVHTLDVTVDGARLGSVRHELTIQEEICVFYRQRKMQFRVVWIKKLPGTSEFQVGLQAVTRESEPWGLSFTELKPAARALAAV
jgi:hypothetical protein